MKYEKIIQRIFFPKKIADIPKEPDIFKMIKEDFCERYGDIITTQDLLLIGSMSANYIILCEKKLRLHQHKHGALHFDSESELRLFENSITQQENLIVRQSDRLGLYPSKTRLARMPEPQKQKIRKSGKINSQTSTEIPTIDDKKPFLI